MSWWRTKLCSHFVDRPSNHCKPYIGVFQLWNWIISSKNTFCLSQEGSCAHFPTANSLYKSHHQRIATQKGGWCMYQDITWEVSGSHIVKMAYGTVEIFSIEFVPKKSYYMGSTQKCSQEYFTFGCSHACSWTVAKDTKLKRNSQHN